MEILLLVVLQPEYWEAGGSRASIINCFNSGNIIAHGDSGGGIGGEAGQISFMNCYNVGNVSNHNKAGGIAGSSDSMSYCYNSGNIHGSIVGGIRARGYDSYTSNCHNTGNVETTRSDGLKYCGEIAGDYYDSGNKYSNCTYLNKANNANSNGATGVDDMTETMALSNFVNLMNTYANEHPELNLKQWELVGEYPAFKK